MCVRFDSKRVADNDCFPNHVPIEVGNFGTGRVHANRREVVVRSLSMSGKCRYWIV